MKTKNCPSALITISFILLILLPSVISARTTYYVIPDGSGDYTTIQAAINAAGRRDTVLVADGNYIGEDNRNISFFGKAITVRSENGPENCIIDCQGLGRGFYFQSYESSGSVLDGFTIINGYVANSDGGGILCERSSPKVINCIFRNNTADPASGQAFGGGICNFESSPTVTNCVFIGNSGGWGGGMANLIASSPTLTNCVFIGNSTQHMGGGMFNTHNSHATVRHSIFINNSSSGGGGMWNYQSNVKVTNCTFSGNSSKYEGGGIYTRESHPVLSNCILWNNRDRGGTGQSSQIYVKSGSPSPVVNYSCIKGWTGSLGGTGNIGSNPLLESDGYRLRLESPCINAGDPAFIPQGYVTDIDGRLCIIGGRVDMGAYEFNHTPIADTGPDQTVYAWFDGVAKVILDGTGSYDDDGQPLSYLWIWTVDGNNFTATGPRPLIELPIGEYAIELTVSDDINDSEPNEIVIIVIPPMETTVKLTPQALNTNSQGKWVKAHFVLPEGFEVEDINANMPATMEPFGIESEYMNVFVNEEYLVEIEIAFRRAALCGFKIDEPTEIAMIGLLTSGQYFYGTDTIKIVTNGIQSMAVFLSYWLENCGLPEWCNGFDINQDSVVNFVDFVVLDDCYIEVVSE